MKDGPVLHSQKWWAAYSNNATRHFQEAEKAALVMMTNARKELFKEQVRFAIIMSMKSGDWLTEKQMEQAMKKHMKKLHREHRLKLYFCAGCPFCHKDVTPEVKP